MCVSSTFVCVIYLYMMYIEYNMMEYNMIYLCMMYIESNMMYIGYVCAVYMCMCDLRRSSHFNTFQYMLCIEL